MLPKLAPSAAAQRDRDAELRDSKLAVCLAATGCDLALNAAANLQIEKVTELYLVAEQRIRLLLSRSPRPDADALRGAADLPAGFARAERLRARVFGGPVSFGSLRAAAAGALTVVFGAWSIARGNGVGVVLGTVCGV
ncbi:hypothetical protein DFJ74DRAFT_711363 [Hyaloraphidium curvatum]|nr:hypothetical protein DFJ74DRAFT_711363 [Hyaloraphidium curvatum]